MKVLFTLLLALGVYLITPNGQQEKRPTIQPGVKAYVRVEAKNVQDTVKVQSTYLSLLTFEQLYTNEYKINRDSSFLLSFDNGMPTQYNLSLDKDARIPIFAMPGDTLIIRVDYQQNKGAPKVIYERHTAEINQYLYDKPEHIAFSREAARLFNNPSHLETPEKTLLYYKHKSDSMAAIQQAYVREKADWYNLPAWFVELEEIESQLFARYHQLVIVDYWETFFGVNLNVPHSYYTSIKPVDITIPSAIYSFFYYLYLPAIITKSPDFLQDKRRFLDSCGVKTVDDLKGTKAYATYYLRHSKYVVDKAVQLLPEQSLYPFLSNHYFHMAKVLDRAEEATLYDYVKPKLHKSDIWQFFANNYEQLSLDLSRGKEAPDFYLLSSEDDRYFTLDDFKGKVVLLNFWFPGCKPCIYEIPHERRLIEKYADKGFSLINICMQATTPQWQTALKKYDLHGVNLLTQGNWERKLMEAYAVDGFPHYVLVDREGKIVENGTHKPSDQRLAALIEATIKR